MNNKLKQEVDKSINGLFKGNNASILVDPILGNRTKNKSILTGALIRHGNLLDHAYADALGIEANKLKFEDKDAKINSMVKPDFIYNNIAYEIKRGIGDADTKKAKGELRNLLFLSKKFSKAKLISHYGNKPYFRSNKIENEFYTLNGKEQINKHFGFNIWDKVEEMTKYFRNELNKKLGE